MTLLNRIARVTSSFGRSGHRRRVLATAVIAVMAFVLTPIAPSQAAVLTINVSITTDTLTPSQADCTDNEPGSNTDCSLRSAIILANANPGSTINLPAGTYNLTRDNQKDASDNFPEEHTGTWGDLDITASMTINGTLDASGLPTSIINGSGLITDPSALPQNAWTDRVIHVNVPGGAVTISGVIIEGGVALRQWKGNTAETLCATPSSQEGSQGGSAAGGGGVWNESGSLTISNSIIRNNKSGTGRSGEGPNTPGGDGGRGGGICNDGVLMLTNSTVSGNETGNGGDGFDQNQNDPTAANQHGGDAGNGGNGGGIASSGSSQTSATVKNSTISGNKTGAGGIGGDGGNANSPQGGDQAAGKGGNGGNGGGLYLGATGTNTDLVQTSTISGNTTGAGGIGGRDSGTSPSDPNNPAGDSGHGGDGAGMYVTGTGVANLVNSTVSGNTTGQGGASEVDGVPSGTPGRGGNGGGANVSPTGNLQIDSATVVLNTASPGGGPGGGEGGSWWGVGAIFTETNGKLRLTNTIVGGNPFPALAFNTGDLKGAPANTASSNNLIGDAGSAGGLTNGNNGNLVGNAGTGIRPINTVLDTTLADNGGTDAPDTPTKTHKLIAGSPALNAGATAVAVDQRGQPRPSGPADDIGAYEEQTAAAADTRDTIGIVDISNARWHLRNTAGAVTNFLYGNPGDLPVSGDYDMNGSSTPGLYRSVESAGLPGGFFYARNSNSTGIADDACFAGNPSDIPLMGDWDGDGKDTLGIMRLVNNQPTFFLFNTECVGTAPPSSPYQNGMGAAQISFAFGDAGDIPVVGDWDGDGKDTIGLYRSTESMGRPGGFFYNLNSNRTGAADNSCFAGNPSDLPVGGDWDGDGDGNLGLWRYSEQKFYLFTNTCIGNANASAPYANAMGSAQIEAPLTVAGTINNLKPVAGAFGLG